jgi:hypothetical protein
MAVGQLYVSFQERLFCIHQVPQVIGIHVRRILVDVHVAKSFKHFGAVVDHAAIAGKNRVFLL